MAYEPFHGLELYFSGRSSVGSPDGARVSATNWAESTSLVVREIRVDLQRVFPKSWIVSIDWGAFAAITVASFPQLESIMILAETGSDHEAAYMEHAHGHLQLLSQEHGINLDVSEGKGIWRFSTR